jgi:hypothetical protein
VVAFTGYDSLLAGIIRREKLMRTGVTFVAELATTGSTNNTENRINAISIRDRRASLRPSRVELATLLLVVASVLPSAFAVTTRADTVDGGGTKDAAAVGDAAQNDTWRVGQVMDFRVVDRETREPISDVTLELQNMGKGIDFQDVKVQTTDADGRSLIKLPDLPPTAVRVYPSKAGFVPLRVYWASEPSPAMPDSITIPMDQGKAFGGTIQDEDL